MMVPANAWVLSPMRAPASDLRRVKLQMGRGGAVLLSDGIDYVRVLQNGPVQHATASAGLLLNVTFMPEMNHDAGMGIQASSLVYLPRKLNASTASQYACMPLYFLVGHQLN